MSHPNDLPEPDLHPLIDVLDHEILMHRDAHFGGQFSIMLDYYRNGGRGVQQDFSIERIQELTRLEEAYGENLAPLVLLGEEIEQVARAKKWYRTLQTIYEKTEGDEAAWSRLIADLIFTEEELPKQEVEAIRPYKKQLLPFLLRLIKTEDLYDPLAPGYGEAPFFAAYCLGELGATEAIHLLFERIGEGDFFQDEHLIRALGLLGEPARDFLLKIIQQLPVTQDNVDAAQALMAFNQDIKVADQAINMLRNPEFRNHPSLSPYLVYLLSHTLNEEQRLLLKTWENDPKTDPALRQEIQAVLQI